ncbi:MAG: hypothetical protein KF805_00465 [Phycisphaeraceae bacterium]|nr:hypothetical protein [Phycisphaeraceae bacterium]
MKRTWDERIAHLLTIGGILVGAAALIGLARVASASPAETPVPAAAPTPAPKPAPISVVGDMKSQAAAATALCETDAARSFLSAASALPSIAPRVIYRDRERGMAITEDAWQKLSAEEQAKFKPRDCDERFYYYTGYGTPLNYARAFDIAGKCGVKSWEGMRVLDFGYGSIGHLRMLASLGADAQGVEIEPLFAALYSWTGDQGSIAPAAGGKAGNVTLHNGRWPGDAAISKQIGGGYDLFLSKNTLKRGYIHPDRAADERMLVKLGVEDEAFLKAVHDALKPGGLMIVYNIAPAQNPDDKPFLPMADGRFPFDRALTEKVGFEVLAFDQVDDETMHKYWFVYFPDPEMTAENLKESIFTHYTVLRKK